MNLEKQKVTQAQFASIFGISQALVSKLLHQGILKRGGTLGEWSRAYVDRAVELVTPSAGDAEYEAERTLMIRARRQIAEIDLQERRGEVIKVDAHIAKVSAVYSICRQIIWSWVGALPAQCEFRPAAAIADIVEREARRLFADMHRDFERYEWRAVMAIAKYVPADVWREPCDYEANILELLQSLRATTRTEDQPTEVEHGH